MDELKIKYNKMSKKRQSRIDRIQLITVSFALTIGFIELFKSFIGLLIIIPILAFIISVFNIFIVIRYAWFNQKFGSKFESIIFIINGIIVLITGLSFQFVGEHNVQYVYYIMAIFYIFFIPVITKKIRSKLVINFLSEKIIVFRSIFKPKKYVWKDIDSISWDGEILKIGVKNKRKKKYYLIIDDKSVQSKFVDFLKMNQNKYRFLLESL